MDESPTQSRQAWYVVVNSRSAIKNTLLEERNFKLTLILCQNCNLILNAFQGGFPNDRKENVWEFRRLQELVKAAGPRLIHSNASFNGSVNDTKSTVSNTEAQLFL